jgi:hypothetical protein
MKTHSGLSGVLAAALAFASWAAWGAPPASAPAPAVAVKPGTAVAAPHLEFDETTVDLGDVVRGQDANAVFTYRNTGDAELKILAAKPG